MMKSNPDKQRAIATRLGIARTNAGLSQGQVAKMLELHRPTISEIEAARRRVSAEELGHFARIYGVSFEWLGCVDADKPNERRDRIQLAARELTKLKSDDLEKVMNLLTALRGEDEDE